MKTTLTLLVLTCLLTLSCFAGLSLARQDSRETGRSRGFGFVEMPNKSEGTVVLVCDSEPVLLTQYELADAVLAFVAQTGNSVNFVGFRPVDEGDEFDETVFDSDVTVDRIACSWRDTTIVP